MGSSFGGHFGEIEIVISRYCLSYPNCKQKAGVSKSESWLIGCVGALPLFALLPVRFDDVDVEEIYDASRRVKWMSVGGGLRSRIATTPEQARVNQQRPEIHFLV